MGHDQRQRVVKSPRGIDPGIGHMPFDHRLETVADQLMVVCKQNAHAAALKLTALQFL
jgi:hypothetical protein